MTTSISKPTQIKEKNKELPMVQNRCKNQKCKNKIKNDAFEIFAEGYPDPMIKYDIDGKIIYLNKLLQMALQVNLEEIIGKETNEFWSDGRFFQHSEKIKKCIHENKQQFLEYEFYMENGSKSYHLINFIPERNSEGSIAGVISYWTDVTEKKTLEIQLETAARLISLGTVVAHIAHEINNPLMTMYLRCNQLQKKINQGQLNNQDIQDYILIVKQDISRISNIISSSRNLARDGAHDNLKIEVLVNLVNNSLLICESKIVSSKVKDYQSSKQL